MNLSLRFLPEVAEEISEAQAWYESQRLDLGGEFLAQLSLSLIQIQDRPLSSPLITKTVRRFILKRFPYCIYFVVREHDLVVLAILHGRRKPTSWKRRKPQ